MSPQCQQEDTNNRDDLVIDPNSCLSDLLDSLNWPNSVNSVKVLLHLRKKSIGFISAEQESPPAENCTRHITHSITCQGYYSPVPELGYPPGKGTRTRDLGKNLGLGYPPGKGMRTRDLGKNLGLGYPPGKGTRTRDLGKNLGLGYPPGKGPGTRDLGKNLGLGYPPGKGPGTRDLGKNLGLGYPPVWTDKVKTLPCSILRMRMVIIAFVVVFLIECKLSVSY